ncbi:MAG: hypothetical protein A4E57_04396 [Syntrophorhabdaceae bacterium PtaU1.Bin034]|nr:MAG: hypothetical protein A4E57_04396 [Syntrophorhabdaceae bacterium PtaU1.Bin034]
MHPFPLGQLEHTVVERHIYLDRDDVHVAGLDPHAFRRLMHGQPGKAADQVAQYARVLGSEMLDQHE